MKQSWNLKATVSVFHAWKATIPRNRRNFGLLVKFLCLQNSCNWRKKATWQNTAHGSRTWILPLSIKQVNSDEISHIAAEKQVIAKTTLYWFFFFQLALRSMFWTASRGESGNKHFLKSTSLIKHHNLLWVQFFGSFSHTILVVISLIKATVIRVPG